MSDFYNPQPPSAPGRFRVTDACTHCAICVVLAPELFGGGDSEWKIPAFIKRQPEGAAELALTREALEACPCGAIEDSGA